MENFLNLYPETIIPLVCILMGAISWGIVKMSAVVERLDKEWLSITAIVSTAMFIILAIGGGAFAIERAATTNRVVKILKEPHKIEIIERNGQEKVYLSTESFRGTTTLNGKEIEKTVLGKHVTVGIQKYQHILKTKG